MAKKVDAKSAAGRALDANEVLAGDHETDKTLRHVRKVLLAAHNAATGPISVLHERGLHLHSWERHLVDPAFIELALSLDLPLQQPPGDARSWTFFLDGWAKRGANAIDELRRVEAHPFFGAVLAASFLPTRETKDAVGEWLARAVTLPHDTLGRVWAALDAMGDAIVDRWTIGALETHEEWIDRVCQPAVFARCPRLARAVRGLTAARLLRNQLRGGLLDEWGVPGHDEAIARLSEKADLEMFAESGPYPFQVLFDKKAGRVIAYGPEGIVLDRASKTAKGLDDARKIYFVDGDVALIAYNEPSQWIVAGGKPYKLDPYLFLDPAAPGGGVVTKSLQTFRKGDRRLPTGKALRVDKAWCDGERFYAVPTEAVVRRDGTPFSKGGDSVAVFDPNSGKQFGADLPRWMASRVGDGLLVINRSATFTLPAPKGAESSPIGAKDGLVGFALIARDGELFVEGVDGRRAGAHVNALPTAALVTFPAREGLYPVVQSGADLGVALPDGTTPLIKVDSMKYWYWAGSQPLPLTHWGLLRPRDLDSSRALAACTDEAAKAILAAAPPMVEDDDPAKPPPALVDAIRRALPAVTHPRIVIGVAGVARAAARASSIVARLKTQVTTLTAPRSDLKNDDVDAVSRLFRHHRHWWIEKLGIQLGQQIMDVSTFLFTSDLDETITTPAPTVVPWPLLLVRMGELLYRVLAPGTPIPKRDELRKMLALWLETPMPKNLAQLRLVTMAVPRDREELIGLDREHPQRLVRWENRYHLRWADERDGRVVVRAIEATHDDTFRVPEGAVLDEAEQADTRFDERAIRRALALFDERKAAKFHPSIAKTIAEATGLSTAAATLLWSGGYEPWLMPEAKLERFGVTRDALTSAERELRGAPFDRIYSNAMPANPEEMYDNETMARRLVDAIRSARGVARREAR